MKLPRYSKYKDSGAEWLGSVPEHWNMIPLWVLFKRTKRTSFPDEDLLSVYRDYGVVPTASRDDNNNRPSEDLSAYQLVVPGDLVINKMKAWQGSVAISEHRGIVSPAYFVYEGTSSNNRRFLHYLFRSRRYIAAYLMASKGIRVNQWDLDPDYHSRTAVLLPPNGEQDGIATFLDSETAKIDGLIAHQQHLIELLKEKRQTVISHAVTKGLNPNVPMKPSGIEWLGEVPAHWTVGSFKRWFQTASGGTPDTSKWDEFYTDGDDSIPWIRTTDLNNSFLDSYVVGITRQGMENSACKILPPGCVLIAMYGGDGTIGKNALLGISACINQAVCALLPSTEFINEYAFQYIQFYRPHWMIGAASTRKDPNISQELIRNAPMLRPPLAEQIGIVNHLRTTTSQIDSLITDATHTIDLLQERRSALISAAVTGKIDVRGLASTEAA